MSASACEKSNIYLLELEETVGSGGAAPASGGAPSQGGAAATGGEVELGGQGGVVIVEPPPPPPPPEILLVVDQPPISTDAAVEARLIGLGGNVTRIAETVVKLSDTEGFDLVVVSPSADRVDTPQSLNQAEVPLLLLEPTVSQAMKFGPVNYSSGQTKVLISQAAHPIAAGLSGVLTICSGNVAYHGFDIPAENSIVTAEVGTETVLFAFEAGDLLEETLPEETLPARRVGISFLKNAGCQTEQSWEFFDSSVAWLLGE